MTSCEKLISTLKNIDDVIANQYAKNINDVTVYF